MPTAEPDPRSDADLIAAINAGDAAAFDALYLRHRDWVLRVALRVTRNPDAALDVLQDTFLSLLRRFPGFRLTAQLTTFLYPIIKHRAIDAARTRRTLPLPPEFLENSPAGPPTPFDPRESLAPVLDRLSDEHREILLLRFVDDLSLAEIAETLSIPLGTVKSRLHAAIATLRDDPRTRRFFEP